MLFFKVQNIILVQIPFLSDLISGYGIILKIVFAVCIIAVFGLTAKFLQKEIIQNRNHQAHNS